MGPRYLLKGPASQIRSKDELTKENLRHDFYDTYWDERYTVRPNKLPVFLEGVSDKILTTGKVSRGPRAFSL